MISAILDWVAVTACELFAPDSSDKESQLAIGITAILVFCITVFVGLLVLAAHFFGSFMYWAIPVILFLLFVGFCLLRLCNVI